MALPRYNSQIHQVGFLFVVANDSIFHIPIKENFNIVLIKYMMVHNQCFPQNDPRYFIHPALNASKWLHMP
jgi:hypothetical protein